MRIAHTYYRLHREELHAIAASRGRFIRRINALVHDGEMPLVAVGFSLVLYLVYQIS